MKISGKLEWTDYLKASLLHARPPKWLRLPLYIMLGLLALGYVANLVLSVFSRDLMSVWSCTWPLIIIAGAYVLYRYVFLPWRVRRLFEQQKALSSPFEHEITPEAFRSSNEIGQAAYPWGHFRKWKEDGQTFLLYVSDVLFLMLPKRFCTEEQLASMRTHLQENKVPEATRSYRGCFMAIAVYILLLIMMGGLMYIMGRHAIP